MFDVLDDHHKKGCFTKASLCFSPQPPGKSRKTVGQGGNFRYPYAALEDWAAPSCPLDYDGPASCRGYVRWLRWLRWYVVICPMGNPHKSTTSGIYRVYVSVLSFGVVLKIQDVSDTEIRRTGVLQCGCYSLSRYPFGNQTQLWKMLQIVRWFT